MRRHQALALSLGALLVLAGCPQPGEQAPDTPPGQVAEPAPPFVTVYIGFDEAGNTPTVSLDPVEITNKAQSPVIRWAAAPDLGNREWIVGFGGASPFRNGQVLFDGGTGRDRAPIDSSAAAQEYKYWVWVSGEGAADDTWYELDPKVTIIDDATASGPAGPQGPVGEASEPGEPVGS